MKTRWVIASGVAVGAGVGAAVSIALRRRRSSEPEAGGTGGNAQPSDGERDLPGIVAPRPFRETPFAGGVESPVWPVQTEHRRGDELSYRSEDGKFHGNWARRFGAPRSGGSRFHAGVDLFADAGDAVLAIADGVVVALQSFHLGSWAILVDHGPFVMLYGEVAKGSWGEFGVQKGSRVRAGAPVARVACMDRNEDGDCTSHMLHVEAYAPGATRNERWYSSDERPANLLDPSMVLFLARLSGGGDGFVPMS